MPHVDAMFPTRFISAGDLKKIANSERVFVIKEIVKESGRNPKTKKEDVLWVAYFQGAQKGLRIRKSNIPVLRKALGETSEEWVGKEVLLVPVDTRTGPGVRMMPKGAQLNEMENGANA